MFNGVYTALVTPFSDGKVDYESLEGIIEHQIEGGVDGVVPMGTTGESPTLSFKEHKELITHVVRFVNGRVKVVAGTGANATREAVDLSRSAEDDGVDGVLSVNPYYNKPGQKGLIAHFETVANSLSVPVMLYNIPGRTGVNFLPESVLELLDKTDNIVAMKEASGSIAQMMRLKELVGDRITILSGDDNLLLPLLGIGGDGVVSVLSNLLPADVKRVITLFREGDLEGARQVFYKLLPLARAMFLETNPIPIKYAMEVAGFCSSDLRLPLTQLTGENRIKVREAMLAYGLEVS